MTVGIGKEMMDATPGGSGFSFVDLAADRAGVLFASAATNSSDSARALQMQVRRGLNTADYCPDIEGYLLVRLEYVENKLLRSKHASHLPLYMATVAQTFCFGPYFTIKRAQPPIPN